MDIIVICLENQFCLAKSVRLSELWHSSPQHTSRERKRNTIIDMKRLILHGNLWRVREKEIKRLITITREVAENKEFGKYFKIKGEHRNIRSAYSLPFLTWRSNVLSSVIIPKKTVMSRNAVKKHHQTEAIQKLKSPWDRWCVILQKTV